MGKISPISIASAFICGLYIVFLFLGPLSFVLLYSLHGRDYFGGITPSWSLDGWRDLFSRNVMEVMLRSLLMSGANTITCVAIGIPVALSIYRSKPRAKRLKLALLVLPLTVNTLLVAYSWQVLLGNAGVFNSLMLSIGIRQEPAVILFTPAAVMLGLFGAYLPFFVAVFSTSLERLDPGYLTASKSLGATDFQTFRNIILPMTKPGLITGTLMVFLPSYAEYVIPDLLGGGKVFLIGNLTQFAFYEGRNWPMGAALMITTILILGLFTIPVSRYIRGVFYA